MSNLTWLKKVEFCVIYVICHKMIRLLFIFSLSNIVRIRVVLGTQIQPQKAQIKCYFTYVDLAQIDCFETRHPAYYTSYCHVILMQKYTTTPDNWHPLLCNNLAHYPISPSMDQVNYPARLLRHATLLTQCLLRLGKIGFPSLSPPR